MTPLLHSSRLAGLLLCLVICGACGADPISTSAHDASNPSPDSGSDDSPDATDTRNTADAGDLADSGGDIGDAATDAGTDAADAAEPLCTEDGDQVIRCRHHTDEFDGDYETREVHWQTPLGDAPAAGWPTVILFQGSFYSAQRYWEGRPGAPMGLYHRAETLRALLEAGYTVITPEARANGTTFWDTNIAPWATSWTTSPDHHLMLDLFAAIDDGQFGPVDPERLYAAGISSGGYMTSRMAVSYPGVFRALAIHSASYCWCGGYNCYVPSDLPDDHPPTLFVHGRLDNVVPMWTMTPYEEGLSEQGTPTRLLIDDDAGHEWSEQAPSAILDWFDSHR